MEASETDNKRHEEIEEAARTINPKFLDYIEAVAATALANKRPMGPR